MSSEKTNSNKHSPFEIFLIAVVIIFNISIILSSLSWSFTSKLDYFKIWLLGSLDQTNPKYILLSFFYSGMMGGAFYSLRSIYERLGDAYTPKLIIDQNDPNGPTDILNIKVWFFWFLYRPFQSGILAIIIVCLFNQGLLNLNSTDPQKITSLYFQIGFGFLVGFGTHEVINKVEEVIKVLFARKQDKVGPSNSDKKSADKINDNLASRE